METKTGLEVVKPKKVKTVKQEIATVPGNETSNFIQSAIANGASAETLERLFALHEKVQANRARAAYVVALADFQGECPVVQKLKKVLNKDGRTVRYQYAPLDSIVEQVKSLLAKNRLSYKWEVENKPGIIKATVIITHEMGHSEASSFEIPIDTEGYMTAPQKVASALTFAKRYTFCNALGISTGDEDTDATDVNKEPAAKSPKAQMVFLLRTLGVEPKDPQEYPALILKMTQLQLTEKNLPEIVARLSMQVEESQEYGN
jgi:ERF superfamily